MHCLISSGFNGCPFFFFQCDAQEKPAEVPEHLRRYNFQRKRGVYRRGQSQRIKESQLRAALADSIVNKPVVTLERLPDHILQQLGQLLPHLGPHDAAEAITIASKSMKAVKFVEPEVVEDESGITNLDLGVSEQLLQSLNNLTPDYEYVHELLNCAEIVIVESDDIVTSEVAQPSEPPAAPLQSHVPADLIANSEPFLKPAEPAIADSEPVLNFDANSQVDADHIDPESFNFLNLQSATHALSYSSTEIDILLGLT